MSPRKAASLKEALRAAGDLSGRRLWGKEAAVALGDLLGGTTLGGRLGRLAGRCVLIAASDQLMTAAALIELDGVARRVVLCPPDLPKAHLAAIVAGAGVETIVSDRAEAVSDLGVACVTCALPVTPASHPDAPAIETEWVLLTSGTTGVPKMVVHGLKGLTAAIKPSTAGQTPVWGTFYDIRRYGGLQIFLRAVLGSGSMVLSSADEPVAEHLNRLATHGVTHLSGTPSHWRRAAMSPAARAISPAYVRLSGEIADQAILDSLRRVYPNAAIGHAYASTEAGVGFEVDDGREGFPAALVGRVGEVEMKVEDGSLRIRSPRAASVYVGSPERLADAEGFVDTGDMVELRGDRYYFVGRRGGIINVGGLKVHPEEVEAAINRHGDVRMSLVKARKSPITGAIVVADVVLNEEAAGAATGPGQEELKNGILRLCRDTLPGHKVPAAIRFVASLDVTAAGKLARHA